MTRNDLSRLVSPLLLVRMRSSFPADVADAQCLTDNQGVNTNEALWKKWRSTINETIQHRGFGGDAVPMQCRAIDEYM